MPVTRAQVENELLVRRALGFWLTEVGLDGTTVNGTNTSLNAPLRWAIRSMGASVTDPLNVVDNDFSAISPTAIEGVLLIARLNVLKLVRDTWPRASEAGRHSPDMLLLMFGQLSGTIRDLQKTAEDVYGENLGTVTAGSVTLGFMSTDPMLTP